MSEEEQTQSTECTIVIPGEPIIQLTENGVEGFEILCRLCANRSDHLISIYSEEGISNGLAEKMNIYLPVKVAKSDVLPLQCCYQCASTVLTWHELVIASVEADRRLRSIQDEVEKQLAGTVEPGPSQVVLEKSEEDEQCAVRVNLLNDIVLKTEEHTAPANNTDFTTYMRHMKHLQPTVLQRNVLLKESIDKQSVVVVVESNIDNVVVETLLENQVNTAQINKEPRINQQFCIKLEKKYDNNKDVADKIRIKRQETKHNEENSKTEDNMEENRINLMIDTEVSEHSTKEAEKDELFQSEPVRKTFQCALCQRHFFQKLSLERHLRIHRDERPYTCDICGKGFRDKSGLTRHINHVHFRKKNFPCDLCALTFASAATRDDHRRRHTKERPYICQSCGKTFSCKATLYIHAKIHTNVFPFKCSVCHKQFRRKQELLAHSSIHTGARPFVCTECGKCFRRKCSLTLHQLVHTDVKPFECKHCGITYRQARYLKNHVNAKHCNDKME